MWKLSSGWRSRWPVWLRSSSGGPRDRWKSTTTCSQWLGFFDLVLIVLIPKLSRFLVIQNHRVLAAGTVIFALEALYTNLSTVLRYQPLPLVDSLGFAALLFSLGYVALEIVFTNERRLAAIETELVTARQIQASILPDGVPDLENLRIAASYRPMTGVAAILIQFVRTDNHHLGILVAVRVWSRHPGGADFFDDQSGRIPPRSMWMIPRKALGGLRYRILSGDGRSVCLRGLTLDRQQETTALNSAADIAAAALPRAYQRRNAAY